MGEVATPILGGFRNDIVEHVRQCCEEETRSPPIPIKYGDIPISYDAITREWLTAALARDHEGTVVESFTLGPKDNGTSNRRRIEITWRGPDSHKLPASVFCKAAHSMQNRITLSAGGTYSEIYFYKEVRPDIDIEAPWGYYAEYNPRSWAAMIMLTDLGPSTTFCNYSTTLNKAHFIEQARILARLHGRFYDSKEPFFSKILPYKQRFENLRRVGIESACCNGFNAAKNVIPPRLYSREGEIWPATIKSVERNFSLTPTIVHGDVHLGNWYKTADDRMGLTDWQTMARGHWSRDLAYLLATAVSVENRRLWEHDVVKIYLEELLENGGPKVTEAEAWLELKGQSLGALFYWTLTLTPGKSMPDMQPEEASYTFIQRITVFMDDHNALDAFE